MSAISRLFSTATFGWCGPVMKQGYLRPLQQEDLPVLSTDLSSAAAYAAFTKGLLLLPLPAPARTHSTPPTPSTPVAMQQRLRRLFGRRLPEAAPSSAPAAAGEREGARLLADSHQSHLPGASSSQEQQQKQQQQREVAGRAQVSPEQRVTTAKALLSLIWILHGSQLLKAFLLTVAAQSFTFLQPMLLKRLVNTLVEHQHTPSLPPTIYAYPALLFLTPVLSSVCKAQCQRTMIDVQVLLRSQLSCAAPLAILVSLLLLWFQIGWPMFIGVLVLCISMPVSSWTVKVVQRYRSEMLRFADSRIRLVSQFLNGVKLIKMYGWEGAQKGEIQAARGGELGALKDSIPSKVVLQTLLYALPQLAAVASFATVGAVSPNLLDAGTIFSSLLLFQIVRFPLLQASTGIVEIGSALISARRLADCLCLEEQREYVVKSNKNPGSGEDSGDSSSSVSCSHAGGTIRPAFTAAAAEAAAAAARELVCVVGSVGCGKSSLLSAVLGEMQIREGSVALRGAVAYVSQAAWIMNGTVVENVVMGGPMMRQSGSTPWR
ncbi:MAG: hypothetical protein WDW38_004851 [Sanguina aurantia]